MLQTVLNTIAEFAMISRSDNVLVAVSGGPDSVALLHALCTLREELDITLHIAHLNHSFRGDASDQDAEYVRRLAGDLVVPATIERIDVPVIQKTLRLSPEEAARLVRYEFLERVADEIEASRIALGHTADDQVETVLMNILRGTGIDGLRGMPPVRGRFIRPLIAIRRSEIEEYVREHDLHPRIDETNLIPTYTRNRTRLELLPMLRREFNAAVDSAILQLAELACGDTAYMNVVAEDSLKRVTLATAEGTISLDAVAVSEMSPAIGRRVVRSAVRRIRGYIADIGLRHVDELLSLLVTTSSFRYELPGGVFVERAGESLTFHSERPPDQPIIYRYELAVPGEVGLPEVEAVISARVIERQVDPTRAVGSSEAVFDLDSVVGKLVVRSWQPGDRIRPLGMRGSKKLQDVFVDGKIPRRARYRIPVVADDVKAVWVAGLAVSEEARVTEATSRSLVLAIRPDRGCVSAD